MLNKANKKAKLYNKLNVHFHWYMFIIMLNRREQKKLYNVKKKFPKFSCKKSPTL